MLDALLPAAPEDGAAATGDPDDPALDVDVRRSTSTLRTEHVSGTWILTLYRQPKTDLPPPGPPLSVMDLEPWPDASQGVRKVINMEDWAEIRRLNRAERMGVKAIARRLGIARNTVRAALRSDGPPTYERARKGSIVDAVEPQILELLRESHRCRRRSSPSGWAGSARSAR